MDIKNMTFEEFKKLDIECFKKNYQIDWDKHCYDPEKDNCTGGCQGASDCLLAQHFRGDIDERPSKKELINYFLESKHTSLHFEKFMESDEGKKMKEEIMAELRPLFKQHSEEAKKKYEWDRKHRPVQQLYVKKRTR